MSTSKGRDTHYHLTREKSKVFPTILLHILKSCGNALKKIKCFGKDHTGIHSSNLVKNY